MKLKTSKPLCCYFSSNRFFSENFSNIFLYFLLMKMSITVLMYSFYPSLYRNVNLFEHYTSKKKHSTKRRCRQQKCIKLHVVVFFHHFCSCWFLLLIYLTLYNFSTDFLYLTLSLILWLLYVFVIIFFLVIVFSFSF